MDDKPSFILDEKIPGTLYSLRVSQPNKGKLNLDLIMRGRWSWASAEVNTITEPEVRYHCLKILETIGEGLPEPVIEKLTKKVLSLVLPEYRGETKVTIVSTEKKEKEKNEIQTVTEQLGQIETELYKLNMKISEMMKILLEITSKFESLEKRG